MATRKTEDGRKEIGRCLDASISRRALLAGIGAMGLAALPPALNEGVKTMGATDVMARGGITLLGYDTVVNDYLGHHYDYASIPYGQRVTNWEKGWGGRGITWFRSVYYFSQGTAMGNMRLNFVKQIDCRNEVSSSKMYFGEDVHLLVDGSESCVIWIPRNQIHVPNGSMSEFSSSCIVTIPTEKKSIHITSYGTDIPEAPPAEFGGGSAFDFWIDFPGWSQVNLWLYSGALGYGRFPVKNGRYKIRAAAHRSQILVIRYAGSDEAAAPSQPVATFGRDKEVFDWFIASSDGSDYYLVPTCSLACCLNNWNAEIGGRAQTYPDIGGDDANVMRLEAVEGKPDVYRIRCKKTGGYLTYANSAADGNDCTFERASGSENQEWELDQLDEVYLSDEELASVDMDLSTGSSFSVVGNKSGVGCGEFAPDRAPMAGVGVDYEVSGAPAPFPNRLECGPNAYRLVEKGVKAGYTTQGLSQTGQFAPYHKRAASLVWVTQPKGRVPVHFMLLDEYDRTIPLHDDGVEPGAILTTEHAAFDAARQAIDDIYGQGVGATADAWYPGNRREGDWTSTRFNQTVATAPIWLWARIRTYKVEFFADGYGANNLVYEIDDALIGADTEIPREATKAALRKKCNLDDAFGTLESTGFTGWFADPLLTGSPVEKITSHQPGTVRLYGRNRATLRLDYAGGSLRPEPNGNYRTAASEDAPAAEGAMQLPEFIDEPRHLVVGPDGELVQLPAIGADSGSHRCAYYGETLALPSYETIYQRLPDGHWRTIKPAFWIDTDPRPILTSSAHMLHDMALYIHWSAAVADGVETIK